jgi:C4-dicarboxylate-specific signal transduction histidine kinase
LESLKSALSSSGTSAFQKLQLALTGPQMWRRRSAEKDVESEDRERMEEKLSLEEQLRKVGGWVAEFELTEELHNGHTAGEPQGPEIPPTPQPVQGNPIEPPSDVLQLTDVVSDVGNVQTQLRLALEAHAAERAEWQSTFRKLEAQVKERAALESALAAVTAQAAQAAAERAQEQAQSAERVRRLELALEEREAALKAAETSANLQPLPAEPDESGQIVGAQSQGGMLAELEERLHEAHRLEEVGRLAATMTPDIKKLVTSIDQRGAELANALDETDPRKQSAREILALSERAAVLLRQLLVFSEKQSRTLEPIDVNAVVRRVEPVLVQMAGTDIELHFDLGPTGRIKASAEDVERLVTTLVFSGRDLLPVGGTLTVQTRQVDPGTPNPASAESRDAGHYLLTVRVAGYGVQPPQPSSALGLIVQRCGGDLSCDKTPDQGAFLQVKFSVKNG